MENNGTMFHLKIQKGDIGRYVLLPGDPGRVEKIAAYLDNPYHVITNREYNIWNGYLEGELVTVMSTGMGGPSTAIGIEELKMCGAEVLIRVGTCGGIDPELKPGTLVIATGSISKEGTTREYVPIEYPAVPDFELTCYLRDAAKQLGYDYALGVSESKDSFYGQWNPDSMPVGPELKDKWEAWKQAGAAVSEMESAALFIVASVRRMKAATILLLCSNHERELKYGEKVEETYDISHTIETAVLAVRNYIKEHR